jgi:hypothetical protein
MSHTLTPEQLKLHTDIMLLRDLKLEIKRLGAREDELSAVVMEQLFQQPDVFQPDGKISYMMELGRVAVETKWTHTISKEMLVAQGVPIGKITAATNSTESKPYVRIYPKKDKTAKFE